MKLKVVGWFLVTCAVLLLTAAIVMWVSSENSWVNTNNLFKLVAYAEVLYLLASLRSVGPTELGALLLFGRPVVEVESGLVFAPLGLYTLVTETALTMQDQFPGNPEDVDKTNMDTLAHGKVFPIRVTHAAPKTKTDDAIHIRMTTEVSAISRERIKKGQFITFLQTIGGTEEMRRQIRDTVEGGIKREFALRTPSETLAQLAQINNILKGLVVSLTTSWGIEIVDVQVVDIDLGKKVNQSLRDVPDALLKKQVKITDAEAKKADITLVGKATADARQRLLTAEAIGERLLLEAKAIGVKKLAEITKTSEGQIVLWLETMRLGFEKSNHTIIPSGELFSAMSGIQTLLEKTKGVTR